MGEIKKYDATNEDIVFGSGRRKLPETIEIEKLKAGEFWQQPHDCGDSSTRCTLADVLAASASRYFGKGNYSLSHRNGIIAVLRKA